MTNVLWAPPGIKTDVTSRATADVRMPSPSTVRSSSFRVIGGVTQPPYRPFAPMTGDHMDAVLTGEASEKMDGVLGHTVTTGTGGPRNRREHADLQCLQWR